jgi:hypothetical protein
MAFNVAAISFGIWLIEVSGKLKLSVPFDAFFNKFYGIFQETVVNHFFGFLFSRISETVN